MLKRILGFLSKKPRPGYSDRVVALYYGVLPLAGCVYHVGETFGYHADGTVEPR